MSALRRVRAYGGHFGLLAALAMVAALVLTATPRLANGLADTGLRGDLAGLPWQARDITYDITPEPAATPPGPRIGELDERQVQMPPAVRRLISERWYAAQTGPEKMRATGPDLVTEVRPPLDLGLRAASGAQEAVRMVEGRWPAGDLAPTADRPAEAVVSTAVAEATGLRAGSHLIIGGVMVTIVGIFEPVDPRAGVWDTEPRLLRIEPPTGDGSPALAVALTTDPVITALQASGWTVQFRWRYRIDAQRLDAGNAPPVIDGLRRLEQSAPPGTNVTNGLAPRLQRFLDTLASVRALLAVVAAGLLACLGGLIVLAARLAVDRRRAEFTLLLARGGSFTAIAGRSVAETLLVIPVAALIGWAAGAAVPGRAAENGWPVVVLAAVVTTLALPVAALASRSPLVGRRDLVAVRASAGRRTAEISLLVLAALGAFLLRRRGLSPDGAVDPLLVTVPVLLAVGAAVLALRAYPWPLRLVGRLTARARGSAAFLGTARASRSAAATVPVIVLVVAVATAAFCGVVAGGIADGRDGAAAFAIPGDVLLTGDRGFAPDTADELAALPGVRAVTPIVRAPAQQLYGNADGKRTDLDDVLVLVVDGPTLARVAAESGSQVDLPSTFTAAAAGSGPVPALVSQAVAADLPETGAVALPGGRYPFQVTAVVDLFPTIDREVDRFVVLPRPALPVEADRLSPTGFLLAVATVDEATLRAVGDRGQRRWLDTGAVPGGEREVTTTIISRTTYRADLEGSGINALLSFAWVAGAVGGAALGLLAVAFAVVAGARARGRVLSRLRTMGLSRRQSRGLLIYELIPLVGVSVLTGAAVGALLPLLLTPVLRLSTFTDGMPVPVRFEAGVVGGVVALGALALAAAIGVEATINRRMRLGEVLRLGEES